MIHLATERDIWPLGNHLLPYPFPFVQTLIMLRDDPSEAPAQNDPLPSPAQDDDDEDSFSLIDFLPVSGYFIAGGMAGMVSRTATAPLDRLKVYLIAQVSPRETIDKAVKHGSPMLAVRHFTSSLVDACKDLWRAGGIRSLFAGNGLNVVKVMPESAIKFGAYEAAKKTLASIEGTDPRHLHATAQFLAGGFGGVVSQCVVYPLDTLKL